MSKGDGVSLPGGRQLSLVDFEYRSYPDGRPQAWISTVELSPAPGKAGGASRRAIEVNHPLRIGSVSIYQVGYSKTTAALFGNSKAELVRVFGGQTSELAGLGPVFFMAQEGAGPTAQGLFTVTGADGKKAQRLSLGDSLGDWSLEDLREVEVTGLRAATDPGYPAVFAGFILIALGLGLTYIQKLKDMKP
jgi:cytochrome c biogenesis protein ResB